MPLPSLFRSAAARVLARLLLAVCGGYAVTYAFTAALARLLPLPAVDAAIIATLLSFVVYPLFVLWVFACQQPRQLLLGTALALPLYVIGFWPQLSGGGA